MSFKLIHVRDHRRRAPERPHASEYAQRDPVRRQRAIRFECPIERSEASGGDLHAGFYVYAMKKPEIGEGRVSGQVHPIPDDVREALLAAKTPREMESIIAEAEPRLAAMDNRSFLDCDEAANLMIAALRAHGIPHIMVIGESDEGSSHAYVIVDGRRYDPTHQGYGDGHIESATRWP